MTLRTTLLLFCLTYVLGIADISLAAPKRSSVGVRLNCSSDLGKILVSTYSMEGKKRKLSSRVVKEFVLASKLRTGKLKKFLTLRVKDFLVPASNLKGIKTLYVAKKDLRNRKRLVAFQKVKVPFCQGVTHTPTPTPTPTSTSTPTDGENVTSTFEDHFELFALSTQPVQKSIELILGKSDPQTTRLKLSIYNLLVRNIAERAKGNLEIKVNECAFAEVTAANYQLEPYLVKAGGFESLDLFEGTFTSECALREYPFKNQITFRVTVDPVVMGVRVLKVAPVNQNGEELSLTTTVTSLNPDTSMPQSATLNDIKQGREMWFNKRMVDNPTNPRLVRATCSDCHFSGNPSDENNDAREDLHIAGADLNIFNFSNNAIATRAQFHGYSASDAQKLVAFIRSQGRFTVNGAPWNHAFQPNSQAASGSPESWIAGTDSSKVIKSAEASFRNWFSGDPTKDKILAIVDRHERPIKTLPLSMPFVSWNKLQPRISIKDMMLNGDTSTVKVVRAVKDFEAWASNTDLKSYVAAGRINDIIDQISRVSSNENTHYLDVVNDPNFDKSVCAGFKNNWQCYEEISTSIKNFAFGQTVALLLKYNLVDLNTTAINRKLNEEHKTNRIYYPQRSLHSFTALKASPLFAHLHQLGMARTPADGTPPEGAGSDLILYTPGSRFTEAHVGRESVFWDVLDNHSVADGTNPGSSEMGYKSISIIAAYKFGGVGQYSDALAINLLSAMNQFNVGEYFDNGEAKLSFLTGWNRLRWLVSPNAEAAVKELSRDYRVKLEEAFVSAWTEIVNRYTPAQKARVAAAYKDEGGADWKVKMNPVKGFCTAPEHTARGRSLSAATVVYTLRQEGASQQVIDDYVTVLNELYPHKNWNLMKTGNLSVLSTRCQLPDGERFSLPAPTKQEIDAFEAAEQLGLQ